MFPAGPDEGDSDPEYIWQNLATYAVLALLLVAIGARAGRATFVVVNNAFLSIVNRQHDKRVAFAASGWTSMRAYLTMEQLLGEVFLVVALGLVGAMLGLLGAAVFRRRQPEPA